MTFKFALPPGRVVSGSPTYKQEYEYGTKKLKEKPSWWMMVAIPKDPNPQGAVNVVLQGMMQEAWTGYAGQKTIQDRIQGGLSSGFSWKIEDGDSPDNVVKEGRAGCWLFKFSTTFGVMNCCDANFQPMDAALIKCGYYVEVSGNCVINEQKDHTAGIHINPEWVRLLGAGVEIRSMVSPQEAFGNRPAVLPPGATPFTGASSAPATTFTPPPAGGPGFAQQQTQMQPPPPPPPQLPPPPAPQPTAEQVAAQYNVQHHPGYRYNPAVNQYEPDTAPPPTGNGFAGGPGAPAGGTPAHAGSAAPGGFPGTASPSSAFNPAGAYPGAQPHHGFGNAR